MHEASLIRSLLRQAEAVCLDQRALRVAEIHVHMGPLAGVEPALLQSAFTRAARTQLTERASLAIEEIPLDFECSACGARFESVVLILDCPQCRSQRIRVLRGDCLMLENVVLEVADSGVST